MQPPKFATAAEERRHRKVRLAAAFRLFSKFGFDEGVAGHITARDPERADRFWVNPFGMHFGQVRASDLILVNHEGEVVEGELAGEPRRLRHSLRACTRPVPTSSLPRTRIPVRQDLVDARTAARPADPGRLRVLQRSRTVRRLHRRRARPEEGKRIADALGGTRP